MNTLTDTLHPIRRATLLAVGLALAGAASAGDDDNGGHCSATAQLLHTACGYEAADDLFLARAVCVNRADPRERQQCASDARAGYRENLKTCKAQLDWRLAYCPRLGEARYDPPFAPELFDHDFRRLSNPNPYFPLAIGNRWVYRGGSERTTVEVLDKTKLIEGVSCVVVRDLVYNDGRLKEATDDWFAAGRDGSAWYCGEEVKDYESFDGDRPRRPELVSIDGSFKHGRDGAKAGLIMPARPQAGQVFREEFSLANAEDVSEVLAVNYAWGSHAALDQLVPRELAQRLCSNRDCVVTRAIALTEPGVYALKYYARGIGFFLETKPVEGESLQLVECNFDARCAALPQP